MIRINSRSYLIGSILVLLTGCFGYTIGPVQPTYMKGVHKIAVPIFTNSSPTPSINALVTDDVIAQIQQDGTYQITGVDDADAIVKGSITDVRRGKLRDLSGNVLAASQFQVNVTLHFEVISTKTHQVLGSRDASGSSEYFVQSDIATQEQQAIPLAIHSAVVDLVSYLSEGW
jgi:hypothetical protein